MAVTKAKKSEILKELAKKFSRTKSVVFSEYRGLSVKNLSDLRRNLRKADAEFKISKKTLLNLAAKQNNLPEVPAEFMNGPVGATLSYTDELAGLKVLFKFSKENEKLKLLGGIIEGKVVGPDEVKVYAKLPGREELLAKFIGSMNAPVSGFVSVLNNLVSGFVRTLNGYREKKEKGGA